MFEFGMEWKSVDEFEKSLDLLLIWAWTSSPMVGINSLNFGFGFEVVA